MDSIKLTPELSLDTSTKENPFPLLPSHTCRLLRQSVLALALLALYNLAVRPVQPAHVAVGQPDLAAIPDLSILESIVTCGSGQKVTF